MNDQLVIEIMDAWRNADRGAPENDALFHFLRTEASEPAAWAVLAGPEVALLYGQRLMRIGPGENGVVAQLTHIPEGSVVRFESGEREPRHSIGGNSRHWTFELPGDSLEVAGWVSDDGEPDQHEQLARGLATACGWSFELPAP